MREMGPKNATGIYGLCFALLFSDGQIVVGARHGKALPYKKALVHRRNCTGKCDVPKKRLKCALA